MMISGSLHQKHDTKWSEKNNIQHQNHVSNLSSYINVRSSRGIGIFTLLLRTKRFRCTCLCRPSKLAPDCFELLGTRIGRQLQRTEHLAFCLSFCLFFCGQTTPSSGCKKPNQGTSRVNVVWFSEKFGELRLKAFSYVIIILWYPMMSAFFLQDASHFRYYSNIRYTTPIPSNTKSIKTIKSSPQQIYQRFWNQTWK